MPDDTEDTGAAVAEPAKPWELYASQPAAKKPWELYAKPSVDPITDDFASGDPTRIATRAASLAGTGLEMLNTGLKTQDQQNLKDAYDERNQEQEGNDAAQAALNSYEPTKDLLNAGVGYAGNVARGVVTDAVMSAVDPLNTTGQIPAGNTAAALLGDDLPQDETLRDISASSPATATAGKVAQGLIGTAPLLAAGGLPALGQKLVALGFSADMISKAPQLARDLGEELGKNPQDRDQDRLTSLISDAIQTGVFAPLAGAHGLKIERAGAPTGETQNASETERPSSTGEQPRGPQSTGGKSSQGAGPVEQGTGLAGAPEVAPETASEKPTLEPGLQVGDTVYTGGKNHQEIFQKNYGEVGPDMVEAMQDDSKHVFVDQDGKVYSREEAGAALGRKGPLFSEDLPQNQPPPTPAQIKRATGAKFDWRNDKLGKTQLTFKGESGPHNNASFYLPNDATLDQWKAKAQEVKDRFGAKAAPYEIEEDDGQFHIVNPKGTTEESFGSRAEAEDALKDYNGESSATKVEAPKGFLDPADQAHFDAEMDKVGVPVKTVDSKVNAGDPFAKGQIATIDRKTGSIIVDKGELKDWLADIKQSDRPKAIRSLLAEERIHLATDDGGALTYWNNLSPIERQIAQRRYTGGKMVQGMNDVLWGHEALRYRIQQLARMTPTEVISAAGREKWTLKGLTVAETVLRGIRSIYDRTGSKESRAIINHIQHNIRVGKSVLRGANPGARPKKQIESKDQEHFILPDAETKRLPGSTIAASIKPGQEGAKLPAVSPESRTTAEGAGALPRLSGAQISAHADTWITDELKRVQGEIENGEHTAPKFNDFVKFMKGKQSELQPGQIHELWQDGIAKILKNASDEEVRALTSSVLVPKAAKVGDIEHAPGELGGIKDGGRSEGKSGAIWSSMANKALSVGKKTAEEKALDQKEIERLLIGDPNKKLSPEDIENQNEAIKRFKLNRAAADRQVARDELSANRRRQILISNIYRKLVDVTGDKAPVDRKITTDDIRYGGGDSASAVQDIAPDSERNISALTKELLDNSKRNSEDPTTYTKRLTLIQDRKTGKVSLVSTYRRGEDAMLLDPVHPQGHHLPLPDMLRRYRVVQSVLLDEPVQKFKKNWDSLKDYQDDFGTEAKRINDNATSGSGVIGDADQYVNGQRVTQQTGESEGIPGSQVEEGSSGHLQGPYRAEIEAVTGGGRSSMEQSLGRGITNTEAEALFKHIDDAVGKTPETADQVHDAIYDMAVNKPKAAALSAMRKLANEIQSQFPDDSHQDLIKRMAQRIYENDIKPADKGAADGPSADAGKTVQPQASEDQSEVAKLSAPEQSDGTARNVEPRAINRKKLQELVDATEMARDAADVIEKKRRQLGSAWLRRATKKDIKQDADGADRATDLIGEGTKKSLNQVTKDEMIRSSPMVMLATGKVGKNPKTGHEFFYYDKGELDSQIRQFGLGSIKAESMLNDPKSDRLERKVAREWKAAADKMLHIALYTRDHWNDPKLREMSARSRQELYDNLRRMSAGGVDVTDYGPSYFPGRYEGENFSMDGVTFGDDPILGRLGYNKKSFKNYGEALAHGPYIPKSFSAPDIISHSVRNGMKAVNRNAWGEMLKGMKDEQSGMPIAKSAVPTNPREMVDPATGHKEMVSSGWSEPSPEYKLVKISGTGKPIAVLKPYAGIAEMAMSHSGFETHPLAGGALYFSSMLKHGAILIGDTFHAGRLGQYAASLMGITPAARALKNTKSPGGYAALFYRPEDLDEAVRQGDIHPESAAWAKEKMSVNWQGQPRLMTKQEVLHEMVKRGLNASKIGDALYKDSVEKIPLVGKYLYHGLDEGGFSVNNAPSWLKSANLRNFNGWMFDRLLPGLISESAVRNFEDFHKRYPDVDAEKLMRDVNTDINVSYGNLGRQGIFNHPTFRDTMQLLLLAPMWQEGLLGREIRAVGRLTGISNLTGRRGLPQLGTLGEGMAKGLAAYFVMTQMINAVTKGQSTFQNEKGHQLDAWIPTGNGTGVWVSPMSVFAEWTRDIIRLAETKPTVWDAISQVGQNKAGTFGRVALTLLNGKDSEGRKLTSTGAIFKSAASQMAPVPISLGKIAQTIGHGVAPSIVPPTEPGAVQRQMFAAMGIKVDADRNIISKMSQAAQKFVRDNNLRPGQDIPQITDEPGYAQLRHQLIIGDEHGAKNTVQNLLKSHGGDLTQLANAMNNWAKRPFTGGQTTEYQWLSTLNKRELEAYTQAQQARYELLERFYKLGFEAAAPK